MGRRLAGGGSVVLWTMFSWKNLGPSYVTLITNLEIISDLFMTLLFPDGSGLSFNRIMHSAILQRNFRNALRNIKSSRCFLGFQIPQISSRLNISYVLEH